MNHRVRTRAAVLPHYRLAALFALLAAVAVTLIVAAQSSAAPAKARKDAKPTIVLVHGAWADSSSWAGVVKRLQHDGYTVDVFPTPLRGLLSDAAYLRDYLDAISGPIVFVLVPYPGAPTGDVDLYVKQRVFPDAFANDLPAKKAAVLAATQRPVAFSALVTPSGEPAWQTIPNWDLVGTLDHVIPPAEQMFMAERAGARIVRIKASHLPMVSQPAAVTKIVLEAATSVN